MAPWREEELAGRSLETGMAGGASTALVVWRVSGESRGWASWDGIRVCHSSEVKELDC